MQQAYDGACDKILGGSRMVRSRIQTEKGISKLLINEEKQYELAYMTYLTDRNRYEDFVREGYELFFVSRLFRDESFK